MTHDILVQIAPAGNVRRKVLQDEAAPTIDFRITQDADDRITQDADTRITQADN